MLPGQNGIEILKAKASDQAHVMVSVAYHFGNLWFAAQKQNWPLAEFYWLETRAHIAMMEDEVVRRRQWLSESQLLDAIAVGQRTPGPVFTTATFIGCLLGGLPAAAIATAGIFISAVFFVAISGPQVPRIRTNEFHCPGNRSGGAKCSGTFPVNASRKATTASASEAGRRMPPCTWAMT